MATTMEIGCFSGEVELFAISYENIEEYENVVRNWLKLQPASLEPLYTETDIIEAIASGIFFGWLLVKDGYEIGIALASAHRYPRAMVLRLEYLSCQNFLTLAKVYPWLEAMAVQSKFDYIEAIAHPTLGRYALKNLGFSIPSVYMRKPIQPIRKQ